MFREYSHVGRGGGVAIFVRNYLFPMRINLGSNCEYISLIYFVNQILIIIIIIKIVYLKHRLIFKIKIAIVFDKK